MPANKNSLASRYPTEGERLCSSSNSLILMAANKHYFFSVKKLRQIKKNTIFAT